MKNNKKMKYKYIDHKYYMFFKALLIAGASVLLVHMDSVPVENKQKNKDKKESKITFKNITNYNDDKTTVEYCAMEPEIIQPTINTVRKSKIRAIARKNSVEYRMPDGSGFSRKNGTLPWRNNNPGAIRYGDFAKNNGAIGKAGGFAVFPNEETGMNALRVLLQTDGYRNLTVETAVYKYAPPHENNTVSYQQKLSKMANVPLSSRMYQLTPQELERVVAVIKILEGWVPGKEEYFYAPEYKEPQMSVAESFAVMRQSKLHRSF